ncbi:MAG: FkbM family methyltransferase [Saprospiraceae bacterium]|nr:FkbM family methyltransferase [Saprospiraceae bacterium]
MIYKNWIRFRAPKGYKEIEKEQSMYQQFSQTNFGNEGNALIYDVGANEGLLTEVFLQYGNVIAVEPDEFSQRVLKYRFLKHKKFRLLPLAISNKNGEQHFFVQQSGSALNTLSEKWRTIIEDGKFGFSNQFSKHAVKTVTLDSLIQKFGMPNYIKIDTEGHELAVIQGLTKPVQLLSFEANLPEFLAETIVIIDVLTSVSPEYQFTFFANYEQQLPNYVDSNTFKDILANLQYSSIDVFCKHI